MWSISKKQKPSGVATHAQLESSNAMAGCPLATSQPLMISISVVAKSCQPLGGGNFLHGGNGTTGTPCSIMELARSRKVKNEALIETPREFRVHLFGEQWSGRRF